MQNARIVVFGVIAFALIFSFYALTVSRPKPEPKVETETVVLPTVTPPAPVVTLAPGKDPLNTGYLVNGLPVVLENGTVKTTEGLTKSLWNEPVMGDLSQSGVREDGVVILVQEIDGEMAAVFVAAALKNPEGYLGTEAFFLGKNVYVKTIEIEDGVIVVNYTLLTDKETAMRKKFTVVAGKLEEVPAE